MDVTEDYRPLDVRKLHKAGVLVPGETRIWSWYTNGSREFCAAIDSSDDMLFLRHLVSTNGGKVHVGYAVTLSWKPCHFGGKRPWLHCPQCGARVAILHCKAKFACRKCLELTYQVQRETDQDRALRRAGAIRRRLGWPPGIANPPGGKPKGMHRATYLNLVREHNRAASAAIDSLRGWIYSLRQRQQIQTAPRTEPNLNVSQKSERV